MNRACTETFRSALPVAVASWLASARAWAQDVAEPPLAPESMAEGGGAGLVAVLAVGGLLVIIAVAVKLVDLKNRRESESAQLQAQVSDALLRERALTRLQLTPTMRVPFLAGSPVTIDVTGELPTLELKDTVLRIVRDEAARIRSDVRIEERLSVVSTKARAA